MFNREGLKLLEAGVSYPGDKSVTCNLRRGERLIGVRAAFAEKEKKETWVKDFQFLIGLND
jgi:hypothetical protein